LAEQRSNISGKLFNGLYNNDLSIIIFPSVNESSFTLYEDDGVSTGYKIGEVARTLITQQIVASKLYINIAATKDSYHNIEEFKDYEIQVYIPSQVQSVSANGTILAGCKNEEEVKCYKLQDRKLSVKLGKLQQR